MGEFVFEALQILDFSVKVFASLKLAEIRMFESVLLLVIVCDLMTKISHLVDLLPKSSSFLFALCFHRPTRLSNQ